MLFLCCYIVNNNWQCYFHNVIVTKHNVVFVASLLLCMKGSLSFAKLNPPPIYSLQILLLELPCTWITFPSNEGRSLKGMRGVHPARSRGPKSIPPTYIIRWHASKFVDFQKIFWTHTTDMTYLSLPKCALKLLTVSSGCGPSWCQLQRSSYESQGGQSTLNGHIVSMYIVMSQKKVQSLPYSQPYFDLFWMICYWDSEFEMVDWYSDFDILLIFRFWYNLLRFRFWYSLLRFRFW